MTRSTTLNGSTYSVPYNTFGEKISIASGSVYTLSVSDSGFTGAVYAKTNSKAVSKIEARPAGTTTWYPMDSYASNSSAISALSYRLFTSVPTGSTEFRVTYTDSTTYTTTQTINPLQTLSLSL